jgi:hypothetical protein
MTKRMTAKEFASQVYNNYGHGNNNAAELIMARDKATLEAAAERLRRLLTDNGNAESFASKAIIATVLRDEED